MFKSIFMRLMITYLIITVIIVAVLTAAVSIIYKDAIFKGKKTNLEAAALKTVSLAEDYLDGRINVDALSIAVNAMGSSTDAMIYVLRIDPERFTVNNELSMNGINDPFVTENMKSILEGRPVYLEKQFSKDLGLFVLFAGYPLKFNDEVAGAVLLFCPINNISSELSAINRTLGLAALSVMLLSIPLIYLNARRISRPIREMSILARDIAGLEPKEPGQTPSGDEIHMLKRSFEEMKDRLEKTEKIRRELIANVSHELRTPLTSISGFVQAMIDGVADPEDRSQYLKIIQEETFRLNKLTAELLELAKIQSGNVRLQPARVLLNDLVDQVCTAEKIPAQEKGIRLLNTLSEDIFVMADRERLKQILLNIVSNAVRYTPENGSVTISAVCDNAFATIAVNDNGPGISSEDLPFIFDKFYRSDKVRTSDDRSTGLGLSIAKNLTELQGGVIWAESELDKGTKVSFTVPVA